LRFLLEGMHAQCPSRRQPRQHSPHLRVIPTTGSPRGRDATLVERYGDAIETRYARRSPGDSGRNIRCRRRLAA
jgi:hypothetical protein